MLEHGHGCLLLLVRWEAVLAEDAFDDDPELSAHVLSTSPVDRAELLVALPPAPPRLRHVPDGRSARLYGRRAPLEETDGPMLHHGLQGVHNQRIWTPRSSELKPDRDLLERRYERFLNSR